MIKNLFIAWVFLLSALVLVSYSFFSQKVCLRNIATEYTSQFIPEFQRGVCYAHINSSEKGYGSPKSSESLKILRSKGVEWVMLVPFGYQPFSTSCEIIVGKYRSLNDSVLVKTIREIHNLGMQVLMNPQIWASDFFSGEWRGSIRMKSEKEWQHWFANYEKFILHYAKLAEEFRVDIFSIGSEYVIATTEREQDWRKLINKIRTVYRGPLVYAAAGDREFARVKFWDALDYIGINAYFPLTNKQDATVEELVNGWARHLEKIEKMQSKFKKPVIFTEVGYKSTDSAGKKPWEFPSDKDVVNLQEQADLYEAFFRAVWNKPWFYGAYWWKWYSNPHSGGLTDTDFTPQNKPAEQVLSLWYRKQVNAKKRIGNLHARLAGDKYNETFQSIEGCRQDIGGE